MGLLRVEEHDITGTERYCDAKPRKGEMYDWTISEDIIGSCVRTHSTVRKIIVIMSLEEHIYAICVRSINVSSRGTPHIAWWYLEGWCIH